MKYQIKMRKRFYCSCLLISVLHIAWAKNRRDFMEVSWNKGISRRHEIGSWIVWICCEIESKLNWKFIKLCSIQTRSINAKKSGIFWFFLGFEISGIIRNMLCQNMYCIEIGLFYGIWNKYDHKIVSKLSFTCHQLH